jgi:hypothetical protein
MQFRAGTARAGVAHHPEVVLLVAVDDVDFRIESAFGEKLRPAIMRLLVELTRIARAGLIDRGVETTGRKLPSFDNQLPRPDDGFLLEIISERPVAKHLKEGVMVGVKSDILEIVMLASGADAFLGISGTPGGVGALHLAKKNRHELVHTSVGEEQVRRVGQQTRRGHSRVLLLAEEVDEGCADFSAGHGKYSRVPRLHAESSQAVPYGILTTEDTGCIYFDGELNRDRPRWLAGLFGADCG